MTIVSGLGTRGETLGASGNARTPYGDQTRTVSVKGDATTNDSSVVPIGTCRASDPFEMLNAQRAEPYG